MTEIHNLAAIVAIDVVGYYCFERTSPARGKQFGNIVKRPIRSWRPAAADEVIE